MSPVRRVLVAMDSMKGSLTSLQANEAVRAALLHRWPTCEVRCLTVSDGGEGFLDAVEASGTWQRVTLDVCDPLMRRVRAYYLINKEQAVIEMAQASGLCLLSAEERNPLTASTYGTGQLIADALRRGATHITVGLGGSATSDCGQGMLEALHAEPPHPLQPPPSPSQGGGADVPSTAPSLLCSSFTPSLGGGRGRCYIATDVTNPLLGQQGAAHTFARQKAAPDMTSAELDAMVEELESRASAFAAESAARLGRDCSGEAGAGAAGGVGYALMQYMGAQRVSGIDFVLDMANFDNCLSDADLVITGEGHADRQTLMGKVPMGILRRAQSRGIPVVLLAGRVSDREALLEAGFAQVCAVTPSTMPLEQALRPEVAQRNIAEAVWQCDVMKKW